MSASRRSQTELSGRSRQGPVLLLWLRARRRCNSFCGTLSPGAVPSGAGAASPMAWIGAAASGGCGSLPHAVTPPRRGLPAQRARRERSQSVAARGPRPKQLLCPGRRCASVPVAVGGGTMMTFRVVHKPTNNHARCPYRVIEQATGREIEWINQYLDYEMLRRLADATLRTYAHELLHFLRWGESVHHTDAITRDDLTESTLLADVRFQSAQERELTGASINQRVAIADRALRISFPDAPAQIAPGLQSTYWQRAPMGVGQPRPALSRLRVKTSKRTIVPLSVDEVARFWSSFRNSRDLAIVGDRKSTRLNY